MERRQLGILGWCVRKGILSPKIARTRPLPFADTQILDEQASRPGGNLVWLHCSNETTLRECSELIESFQNKGWSCVVSSDARVNEILFQRADGFVLFGTDRRSNARKFLKHWHPDAAVWASNQFRPRLLMESFRMGMPMLYVNAMPSLEPRNWRKSFPSLSRVLLRQFLKILAISQEAKSRLQGFGLSAEKIEISGRLRSLLGSKTLPVVEEERSAMAKQLAGRPVWFANGVSQEELPSLLVAHKRALRSAQNLLLILRMNDQADERLVDETFLSHKLRFARRSIEDFPSTLTNVFVADQPDEEGLWYRVAPVSFLGGSLSSGIEINPFEAAALGSAIICGPKWGEFGLVCRRLADARAARTIAHEDALSDALSDVIQPDAAAKLAHAAWEVTSAGAEVHDRIIELLENSLPPSEPAREAA